MLFPVTFWTPSFVPSDLSGLALWLDASALSGYSLGATVPTWTDGSGNGRNATQATGAAQATYRPVGINGRPALRFQAAHHYDVPAINLSASTGVTLFAVFTTWTTADRCIYEFSDNLNSYTDAFGLIRDASLKASTLLRGNVGYSSFVSTNNVTLTPTLVSAVFDKTLATNEVTNWLNGVSAGTRPNNSNNTTTAFGNRASYIGKRGGVNLALTGDIAEIVLYSRALSTAERQQVEAYLQAKYNALLTSKRVVFDGDSLTYGFTYATNPYPDQTSALLGPTWAWSNYGVDGQTVAQMSSDAATQIDPLYSASAQKNILIAWGGTNDMATVGGNTDATTTHSRISAYCTARRAAGWRVAVGTIIARNDGAYSAGMSTRISDLNTLIRANWTTYADALVDLAADSRLQNANDTTYYNADKLHLNNTGNGVVAGLVRPVVEAL